MKLIYLEWQDAFGNHSWMTEDDVEDWSKGESIIKEVGWVYKEDKKSIVLVSRISIPSSERWDSFQYGQVQKIPKTWIKKRINLTKYVEK